jgi:hypothetical protein
MCKETDEPPPPKSKLEQRATVPRLSKLASVASVPNVRAGMTAGGAGSVSTCALGQVATPAGMFSLLPISLPPTDAPPAPKGSDSGQEPVDLDLSPLDVSASA